MAEIIKRFKDHLRTSILRARTPIEAPETAPVIDVPKEIPTIGITELLQLTEATQTRVGAIRFNAYHDRGMHLLLTHGSTQVFPGPVYITRWRQIADVIPELFNAEVEFDVNYSIGKVTLKEARSLSNQEGWVRPIREDVNSR